MFYFSRLYEAYVEINKLDLFGESIVELPVPQYVIFYNGDANTPDEQILRLSDSFIMRQRLKKVPAPI